MLLGKHIIMLLGAAAPFVLPGALAQDNIVLLDITYDSYPEESSWTLTNDATGEVVDSHDVGTLTSSGTIPYQYRLPDGSYTFVMSDTWGDGICCSYGQGHIMIYDDGDLVADVDGSFASTSTTTFQVGSASSSSASGSEVRIDFRYDNYPGETSWTLQSSSGTVIDSLAQGGCSTTGLVEYTYDLDDGVYTFTVGDRWNDGICCSYGQGSIDIFLVESSGDTLLGHNNGDFGGSVTMEFTVGSGGGPTVPTSPVRIDFRYDNYPGETSWTLSTDSGAVIDSLAQGGNSQSGLVQYNYNLADGHYTFEVGDRWNDGICCGYGQGGIEIHQEGSSGDILLGESDGQFGGSETINFEVGGGGLVPPPPPPPPQGNVRIDFVYDDYPSETSWTFRQEGGAIIQSFAQGDLSQPGLVQYGYDLGDGLYSLTIYDQFGDGICCGYGQGSATIVLQENGVDQVLASTTNTWTHYTSLTFQIGDVPLDCSAPQNCEESIQCATPSPAALEDPNSPASQARDFVCQNSNTNEHHIIQRFALACFAESVTGRAGFLQELFPQNNECESDFITCNSAGHVTHINIENQQLNAEIPAELGLLTALQFFDANRNNFQGTVPASFGALGDLRRFDVEQGGLTGHAFPQDLCSLGQLRDFRADCPVAFCCIRFLTNANYCAYKRRQAARGLAGNNCGDFGPTVVPVGTMAPLDVPVVQECTGELRSVTTTVTAPGTSQTQELTLTSSANTANGGACIRGLLSVPEYVGPINIGIVIDISGSTYDGIFVGTESIGDINGDGKSDTILDAEIAATIKFLESIVNTPGFGNDTVDIGIITFSAVGEYVGRFPPADPNDPDAVNPALLDVLLNLRKVSITNFDDALDKAVEYFQDAPPDRNNVMFFLSDGVPNVCGDGDNESNDHNCNTGSYIYASQNRDGARDYVSELALLDQLNVKRHSIGIGGGSNIAPNSGLDLIDNTPDPVTGEAAVQVTDTDGLVGLLLANPVVGIVESFSISLNGAPYTGIDIDSLVSSPVGFHYGNYIIQGLDASGGATNTIVATCEMSFGGTPYSIMAEVVVDGAGRIRRLRRSSL